jgi:hypothetical protein
MAHILQVSTDCSDLLSRILDRDPKRRLDLDGIQRHPFYTRRRLPSNFVELGDQFKATPLPTDIQVDTGLLGSYYVFVQDARCNSMACALQSLESVDQILREAKTSMNRKN